jgi:hypothetical protein
MPADPRMLERSYGAEPVGGSKPCGCPFRRAAAPPPNLASLARRLHDSEKSAWRLLLTPVFVGGIVAIIFACLPGTPGPNQYGAGSRDLLFWGQPTPLTASVGRESKGAERCLIPTKPQCAAAKLKPLKPGRRPKG